MSKAMSKRNVFLSHSQVDAPWVKAFAQALEKHDVSVWLDADKLRPGDAISDAIEHALRGSDAIVVVLDPATSPSQLWEIGAGLGMRKRLIPIVPADLESCDLPVPLRNVQTLKQGTPEDTAAIVAATLGHEVGHRAS
jgi:hypothetical protein